MSPNFLSTNNYYHFNKHRKVLAFGKQLFNNTNIEMPLKNKCSKSSENFEKACGEKFSLEENKTETSAIHLNSTSNKSVFNVPLLISNAFCPQTVSRVSKQYKFLPSSQVAVCFGPSNRKYHSAVLLLTASYISARDKVLLRKSFKSYYTWENFFIYRPYFVKSAMMVWATECDPNVCFKIF